MNSVKTATAFSWLGIPFSLLTALAHDFWAESLLNRQKIRAQRLKKKKKSVTSSETKGKYMLEVSDRDYVHAGKLRYDLVLV